MSVNEIVGMILVMVGGLGAFGIGAYGLVSYLYQHRDRTEDIQRAINYAGKIGGVVWIAPGVCVVKGNIYEGPPPETIPGLHTKVEKKP
jgi:hypothetical protein